jgi:plastocyanin
MKKCLLLLGAVALLGAGCQPYSSPGAPAPAEYPSPSANMPVRGAPTPKPVSVNVQIKDNVFEPQQLAIHPGDTVVWTNVGKNNHTVTGIDTTLVWDSGNLVPGQTYKRTFDNPGVYNYRCNIHPGQTAQIIVGTVEPQTR